MELDQESHVDDEDDVNLHGYECNVSPSNLFGVADMELEEQQVDSADIQTQAGNFSCLLLRHVRTGIGLNASTWM